jgi:hypothetical protein
MTDNIHTPSINLGDRMRCEELGINGVVTHIYGDSSAPLVVGLVDTKDVFHAVPANQLKHLPSGEVIDLRLGEKPAECSLWTRTLERFRGRSVFVFVTNSSISTKIAGVLEDFDEHGVFITNDHMGNGYIERSRIISIHEDLRDE